MLDGRTVGLPIEGLDVPYAGCDPPDREFDIDRDIDRDSEPTGIPSARASCGVLASLFELPHPVRADGLRETLPLLRADGAFDRAGAYQDVYSRIGTARACVSGVSSISGSTTDHVTAAACCEEEEEEYAHVLAFSTVRAGRCFDGFADTTDDAEVTASVVVAHDGMGWE